MISIPIISIACTALLGFLIFYYFAIFGPAKIKARRENLRSSPFPNDWNDILIQNVPIYRFLPNDLKIQLHGHILIFIDEKHFEGCGGLEITEVMRVCIAAQACMLILNRETDYFPKLKTILIYPETYVARIERTEDGLIPLDDESERWGESWRQGMVVLAWDRVRKDARNPYDGQNLVFHEFAHQLDEENGAANGTPVLDNRAQYIDWNRVLDREFRRLQHSVNCGGRTVLDEYGATNPAEFFAVATETFFEKPHILKRRHPELYEALREYYKVNPVEWV